MRNFQDNFEASNRSFISAFLICMTVPLTLPSPIFSEFFIFCRLISKAFMRVKKQAIYGKRGKYWPSVRGKRAINSLPLTYKIFPPCQIIIYQEKQEFTL